MNKENHDVPTPDPERHPAPDSESLHEKISLLRQLESENAEQPAPETAERIAKLRESISEEIASSPGGNEAEENAWKAANDILYAESARQSRSGVTETVDDPSATDPERVLSDAVASGERLETLRNEGKERTRLAYRSLVRAYDDVCEIAKEFPDHEEYQEHADTLFDEALDGIKKYLGIDLDPESETSFDQLLAATTLDADAYDTTSRMLQDSFAKLIKFKEEIEHRYRRTS
ncbi:MAG: hypothetical protein V1778_04385 [bacterium]